MRKQIVITGGAGFIGRNAISALNERGFNDVLVVDALGTDDKWKNLRGLELEEIVSPGRFLHLLESDPLPAVEAIIHLGACSATTERDANFLLENNYHSTRTLCEWALRHDVRFVYASSAATYGAGEQGYSDADDVTPRLRPLNMYGYSKQLFDLWALRRGLFDRIVGLKYFNVFDPYEDHKGDMRSVVSKAYGQIRKEGRISPFRSYRPEYKDGGQMRDFVYVKDAVEVTLSFLNHRSGGLFNCGTGVARTWNDLAHAVFRAMDLPPQIDMPSTLQGKYQYFTKADMTRLRAYYKATFASIGRFRKRLYPHIYQAGEAA